MNSLVDDIVVLLSSCVDWQITCYIGKITLSQGEISDLLLYHLFHTVFLYFYIFYSLWYFNFVYMYFSLLSCLDADCKLPCSALFFFSRNHHDCLLPFYSEPAYCISTSVTAPCPLTTPNHKISYSFILHLLSSFLHHFLVFLLKCPYS